VNTEFWIPTIISIVSIIWNFVQGRQIVHLNSAADRANLIHKYQFEKEFGIYQELWVDLIALRNAVLALRPVVDYVDPNAPGTKEKRMDAVNAAYKKVQISFYNHRPFYSEAVYKEIENLVRLAWHEAVHSSVMHSHEEKYWKDAEENSKKILAVIDRICKMIRVRIHNV
jgi:hypothetical protein